MSFPKSTHRKKVTSKESLDSYLIARIQLTGVSDKGRVTHPLRSHPSSLDQAQEEKKRTIIYAEGEKELGAWQRWNKFLQAVVGRGEMKQWMYAEEVQIDQTLPMIILKTI